MVINRLRRNRFLNLFSSTALFSIWCGQPDFHGWYHEEKAAPPPPARPLNESHCVPVAKTAQCGWCVLVWHHPYGRSGQWPEFGGLDCYKPMSKRESRVNQGIKTSSSCNVWYSSCRHIDIVIKEFDFNPFLSATSRMLFTSSLHQWCTDEDVAAQNLVAHTCLPSEKGWRRRSASYINRLNQAIKLPCLSLLRNWWLLSLETSWTHIFHSGSFLSWTSAALQT